EENWFQTKIADSAFELERRLNRGRRVTVGVNAYTEGNDEDQIELLKITHEDEQRQRKRLSEVRADRSQSAVDAVLARLRTDAADPNVNLMPALIDASKAYATLGEMMATMEAEFGRHVEVPVI
ncbi:MAG TPA: methylmalonyl-CoA mutase family protein, partial [Ilumatobacteraceae bacterium]|nr:methylmalonyl-CoA mutase family protein [Ilumatobacteraceae bacterium]